MLERARAAGCRRAFVYCNSLSGAVDFRPLAAETGMRIVTPLDVYRRLAPRYGTLAVIAANAPHMDAAYDFVNYLLDGEVSAKVSELINYINCNTAAEAYLSAEFKANPVVYPPDSAFPPAAKRAPEIIQTVDNETNQIYDEMWTAFKNQ